MYSLIIIDDEELTRNALYSYISQKLPEIQIAGCFSNGADAVRYISENNVNIVLTDIRMPIMNGLEVAEYIFRHYPGIITIFISSYSDFEYAQLGIKYSVFSYLLKPLNFAELSKTLLQATQKLDSIYKNAVISDEEKSLFFTELINGSLSKDSLEERFCALSFPGTPSDYKGVLLKIITSSPKDIFKSWQYGKEQLTVAMLNAIRMTYEQYSSYYLYRNGSCYFFIVYSLNNDFSATLDTLEKNLLYILKADCKAEVSLSFNGLDTLLKAPAIPAKSNLLPESSTSSVNDAASENILIQQALSYIHKHFSEDLSRDEVANAVFLSPNYFSSFFKQKTGVGFIDYLTTVRMQKAAELLATNMKINDIAQQCGYQNRTRFFINFRQFSGYSPTEYRKQILKMEAANETK